MKHLTEQDLILLYYGEPDAPEGGREHLQTCPLCSQEADALSVALSMADSFPVPEPRQSLEADLWSRLAPEITPTKRRISFRLWAWLPALGAAALLVMLVVSAPRPAKALSDASRQRILAMSLADHMDRTQMLLTELENTPDATPGDLEPLRARAQDLVDEGRLMRQWLDKEEQSSTLAVVDEADRVLTEAANTTGQAEELKVLRERIGADSLLFRVRVVEANLRTEGQRS